MTSVEQSLSQEEFRASFAKANTKLEETISKIECEDDESKQLLQSCLKLYKELELVIPNEATKTTTAATPATTMKIENVKLISDKSFNDILNEIETDNKMDDSKQTQTESQTESQTHWAAKFLEFSSNAQDFINKPVLFIFSFFFFSFLCYFFVNFTLFCLLCF